MITTNDPLESYIGRLQAQLPQMTLAERVEILDEIRSHVHERVASTGLGIPEVLEKLGPPDELAREYHRGALVPHDRGPLAVWSILRAALAWVMTVAHAVAIAATAIWGYAGAATCFVAVLLRQMFPEQTAIWMTPEFDIGFGADRPVDAKMLLENWVQPLAFGLGVLLLMLTTMALRWLLPRFKRWGMRALQPIELSLFPARRNPEARRRMANWWAAFTSRRSTAN
jgi:uncharacterized membrane protein